ncbi:phenylacrylic acid decarboxylase [Fusarium austroafricanum]|uniref:Phenylacrylic acid decarboxylase n=1 Tax=Fusarium austroafricanum TaxID=2364996 RepID=A0A8H4K299_9HYPO|nr:phenylacrylic acid decarboxylase [Fusarium austroafricanum]
MLPTTITPPASGSNQSPERRKRIIVAMTGATGTILGIKILKSLRHLNVDTHLVMSKWAENTLKYETDYSVSNVRALADYVYNNHDMSAPIASGSFRVDGMVVVPCSMKTLAAISTGYCDDLISRAADAMLGERHRLVLVPVETTDVETLKNLNSILILDIALWGTGFLRNILSRSPTRISTKKGKTLPTEIWLDILSWVEYDHMSHLYEPVYAIETTSPTDACGSEPQLVCNVLEEWGAYFGKIGGSVDDYEKLLEDPACEIEGGKYAPKLPFQVSKSATGNTISVPISHLEFEGKFLFHKLEVADIISKLEGGYCDLCDCNRDFDGGLRWKRDEVSFFTGALYGHEECCDDIICPLCIGREYADAYVDQRCENVDPEDKMPDDEYRAWMNERRKELGYGWYF